MTQPISIAIIGAGAMGSRFGAQFFEAGHDVTLFDGWKEHVEAIRNNGLRVKRGDTEKTIPIQAYDVPEGNVRYDVVFLFVKSQHTEAALNRYQDLISGQTYVVTLQNGIGNIEAISNYVESERIIAGTTTHSSDLLGPGSIEIGGSGKILITQLKESDSDMPRRIEKLLNDSSLDAQISSDTMVAVWEKLAFNAAINTLTGVTGLATGKVGNHPLGKKVMRGIVDEVGKVAAQLDIVIDVDRVMETLAWVSHPDTSGDHLPSMLQDLLKKRKTEIEAINGAVVRKGKKHGIAVPYNETVYSIVKMIEDHY